MKDKPVYQFSDVERALGASKYQEAFSEIKQTRETPSREESLGLKYNRGTRVRDSVSGLSGEVIYGTRKTVTFQSPSSRE